MDVLARVGERRKASIAQVAIAWLLHQPVTTSVIIGARNGNQLKDNLGAVDVKLDETDLKEIDEASRLTPEYPADVQSQDRKPGEKRDWSKLMVKK